MPSAEPLSRGGGAPHQLNTMMLSQFCGARTEPYTGYVSASICKQFKMSLKGTRNVNNALNNLPCLQTPDENLTFGWAMQNLIRERVVHENDYENIATMTALGESFHEAYAARVMFELARMHLAPEDITPHYNQWRDVIHSMNGSFASSAFATLVEDYIRLDPYNLRADVNEEVSQLTRFPIKANLVAKGLVALGKVTTGETPQLTIIGSAVIAWLAAVADWMYDLRIAIYTYEAVHLHSTHPNSADATQIIFVFREEPGIELFPGQWRGSDNSQVESLTSYHASSALRKMSLNAYSYPKSMHVTPFSGRVTWQALLPQVFGRAYHVLDHECATVVGTWIGSIARFFQGLATGEETENASLVGPEQKVCTAAYGPGLVRSLTDWMPELRRLQGKMERALKASSPGEAQKALVENVRRLMRTCGCGICSTSVQPGEAWASQVDTGNGPVGGGQVDDPPRPSDWADIKAPEHGYCLVVLAETIVALGLTLSGLTVAPALYPSRAGVQSLYYSQVLRRLAARGLPWQQHFKLVYGDEWAAGDARRLSTAVMLFSGSRPRRNMVDKLVAVSHEGITAYFLEQDKARRLAKAQRDGARLIRVVSGGINIKWKVFERACVGDPLEGRETAPLGRDDDVWESVEVGHLDEPLYLL